ncbi:MAG: AbrB family transcriptional regulator [Pseudomonadota bacterium]
MTRTNWSIRSRRALTLSIAALGTALFWWISVPLPFLFGPMAACLLAALMRAPLEGFGQVSLAARTVLGVAVGATITPALFAELPRMIGSVALIPMYLVAAGLIGVPFFHRIFGFDRATAYYAAMPGGLQDMILFGQEAGGDIRALSLLHATRVLIIVTLAPVFLVLLYGVDLTNPIGAPASEIPTIELLLMVLAAVIGWKGGERIGLFGAAILGPMIVTAALSLGDFIHIRPPSEAILAAQFLIGTGLGVSFVGVTLRELRRVVIAGASYVVLLGALTAACASIVVWMGLANPVDATLAFSPGGQAEMVVLAIVSGADLGYVVTHHVVRMLLVITGAPLAGRLLRTKI